MNEDIFAPIVEPSATVYSYYSPEVEDIVKGALREQNLDAPSIGQESIHTILKKNYDPGLDDLHLPLMDKYEAFARSEGVIGLDTFANKYFTNGSSEAIFHLLSSLNGAAGEPVYQFDGEYQGYQAYADALGVNLVTLPLDADAIEQARPGVVILSNPASMDGNIVGPHFFEHVMNNHRVILDLAYMGMTQKPLNLDTTNENIIAVVGSLSKPFGMYYYRIGFCYSQEPIASLYGNKWFKNALSIKLGEAVLDQWNTRRSSTFKDEYFELQGKAVHKLNELYNLDNQLAGHGARRAKASDVWLLAHAPLREYDPADLRPFKRGEQNYRFCLTPYYMDRS